MLENYHKLLLQFKANKPKRPAYSLSALLAQFKIQSLAKYFAKDNTTAHPFYEVISPEKSRFVDLLSSADYRDALAPMVDEELKRIRSKMSLANRKDYRRRISKFTAA